MKSAILIGVLLAALFVFGLERAEAHAPTPVAWLAEPIAAAAQVETYHDERPLGGQLLELQRNAIETFWRPRMAPAPEQRLPCDDGKAIVSKTAADLLDDDGPAYGRGAPCQTWYSRADLARIRVAYREGRGAHIWSLRFECWMVYHEVGHALGQALQRFVSTTGAVYDPFTQTWSGGAPALVGGVWVGEWVDGHPQTGVMSYDEKTGTPGDCKTWARNTYRERRTANAARRRERAHERDRNRRAAG